MMAPMPAALIRALLAALLSLMPVADALAEAAVDRNRENCLEIEPHRFPLWVGTSQLHCLKPDPRHTRRDAFGRCQERRFEVVMHNRCDFLIAVYWRFKNGMRQQQQFLSPTESHTVTCGQLSDQCDGAILAYADKLGR